MYAANVEGTRNVIEAAAAAGCLRIVYTSTVGCIGLPEPIEGRIIPSDETTTVSEGQMKNHYKRSKWQAEQVAVQHGAGGSSGRHRQPKRTGWPARCQADPDRPGDRGFPEPQDAGLPRYWAELGPCARRGRRPYSGGGEGRIGERYILGNAEGNWTMKQAFAVLEELTGVRAPKFRVPYSLALVAAYANEALSLLTRLPPKAPLAGVRMARHKMYFNPSKAIRELGLLKRRPSRRWRTQRSGFAGMDMQNEGRGPNTQVQRRPRGTKSELAPDSGLLYGRGTIHRRQPEARLMNATAAFAGLLGFCAWGCVNFAPRSRRPRRHTRRSISARRTSSLALNITSRRRPGQEQRSSPWRL